MYTTGVLSARVTESPPQAQQGFAEPPRINMYSTMAQLITAESDSQTHSSGTQQKKMAESGSPHTHGSETQQKKIAESGSPHTHDSETQLKKMAESGSKHTDSSETQLKKMAESGSPHRTLPGPRTQCRTGLSLASQWDIYRERKRAHLPSQ